MNNIMTTNAEEQQRGQAFLRARKRLEREYNCTTTIVLKWVPNVGRTFVTGFDEQVLVGPVPPVPPEPMKPVEEKKEGE